MSQRLLKLHLLTPAGMFLNPDDQEELENIIDAAAAEGDHQLLSQLHAVARPFFTDLLSCKLANVGDLETLQFLWSLRPRCHISPIACAVAIQAGFWDVAEWLLQHGPSGGARLILAAAYNHGVIQWVYEHSEARLSAAEATRKGVSASQSGNLRYITWLLGDRIQAMHKLSDCQWNAIALQAAQSGQNAALMCLADAGKITRDIRYLCLTELASRGDWTAFHALILHPGMRAAAQTSGNAADGSEDYADFHGGPGDKAFGYLCICADEAARQGRLATLDWLAKHGGHNAVCNEKVAAAAAEVGNWPILELLHSLRPQICWDLCYNAAICNGDVATLEWLRTHNFHFDLTSPKRITPISRAPRQVVPWMAAHMPVQRWLQACSNGRLLYLTAQGWFLPDAQICSRVSVAQAIFATFYGAARWLAKQEHSHTTLGSLSNDLLQKIACEAHIDFCAECGDRLESFTTHATRPSSLNDSIKTHPVKNSADDHDDAGPFSSNQERAQLYETVHAYVTTGKDAVQAYREHAYKRQGLRKPHRPGWLEYAPGGTVLH